MTFPVYPAGQIEHDTLPVCVATVKFVQYVHATALPVEYVPIGHKEHTLDTVAPCAAENVPPGHGVQDDTRLLGEYVPRGHCKQAGEPVVGAYVPIGHEVHEAGNADPANEVVPSGHREQTAELNPDEYVPGEHGIQDPLLIYFPGGHEVQVRDPISENVPLGHEVQFGGSPVKERVFFGHKHVPGSIEADPTGQFVHKPPDTDVFPIGHTVHKPPDVELVFEGQFIHKPPDVELRPAGQFVQTPPDVEL